MRSALSVAMMAMIAGCTSVEDPFLTASISRTTPSAPALATEVAAGYAVAGLPSAIGAPRSVRQTLTGDDDYIRQEIVFANTTRLAGENMLTVEGGRGPDGRFRRAPTENELQREMRRALPGVAMKISPVVGENMHGVYGYATGPHGDGGACIYGWQLARSGGDGGTGGFDRLARRGYNAQVRLRFCHPRIGEERIPLLMQGLTLKPLTRQTIAMLRGVAGTGSVNAVPLFGPEAEPAAPSPVASAEPVRRAAPAPEAAAVAYTATAPVAASPSMPVSPVSHAAKVPLPGAPASAPAAEKESAPARETAERAKEQAAAAWNAAKAKIPMPGAAAP